MRQHRASLATAFIVLLFVAGCGDKKADSSRDDNVVRLTNVPGTSTGSYIGPLADAYQRIDPKQDGWPTEAIGEEASRQLVRFGDVLRSSASFTDSETLITPDFVSTTLVATPDREVFRDGNVAVHRPSQRPQQVDAKLQNTTSGVERLVQLQSEFRSHFSRSSGETRLKFKVISVEPSDNVKSKDRETTTDLVQTKVLFHADGIGANGRCETSSTWIVNWTKPVSEPDGPEYRIRSIIATDPEEVTSQNGDAPLFADCTAAVLGGNDSYAQQLLYSTDHWRSRLPRDFGLDVVANHGLALGDVNGDGLEDLYVCQQGGLPNRLYIQNADGTMSDRSAASHTDWLDYCASALMIDLDNDGDLDLVVATEVSLLLMENNGAGVFSRAVDFPARAQTFSLAACDFDMDGDLDIYCCGYNQLGEVARTGAMGEPLPYHDAQNGGPNLLLRNDTGWNFSDATEATGLEENNNRFSFAAAWEDYDNDGDRDLYVANDYGRNNLYRNDSGHFVDVAAELGVEDMSAGMSVNWADANRDGWMDFYVSNMFSAAGNRITFQRKFRSDERADVKQQFQRHARGNSLFESDGRGGFRDVSVDAGITMGRWAWGSRFCDINNDGWQDIVIANGFITAEDTGDL